MSKAMTRVAIFDVDGTLIPETSAERSFLRFLFRNGYLKAGNLFLFWLLVPWYFSKGGIDQVKGRNKMYLRGMHREKFRELVKRFSRNELKGLFSAEVLFRLKELKKRDYFVILLSGSLQDLVEEVASQTDADLAIGVRLEYKKGRITGRIRGLYPFGEGKVGALRKVLAFECVNWQESWAFADRLTDLPVLNLVGNPVAVYPDARLKRWAQRKGWEIIESWGEP